MRLQRNQLSIPMGKGRETLAACKKNFADDPCVTTLQLYFSLLDDLDRYEDILSIQETDKQVREISLPPTEKNMDIWRLLILAAAKTGRIDFVEEYMPQVRKFCSVQDEFEILMSLPGLYRREKQEEKLAAVKKRLLDLLPEQQMNQYFRERAKVAIEES